MTHGAQAATLPMRFGDALLRQRIHFLHPENEGMSAARTRFQLTPDRVRGRATNAACTATRCR